mgnify:CR=1 FL=1
MGGLNELLERITIEFPQSLNAEEIENELFGHLLYFVPCHVDYTLTIRGRKHPEKSREERYVEKIIGRIIGIKELTRAFPGFEALRNRDNLFEGIKFETVPGYDSVEEFETLPTGKDQLSLIDDVRKAVESYFLISPSNH